MSKDGWKKKKKTPLIQQDPKSGNIELRSTESVSVSLVTVRSMNRKMSVHFWFITLQQPTTSRQSQWQMEWQRMKEMVKGNGMKGKRTQKSETKYFPVQPFTLPLALLSWYFVILTRFIMKEKSWTRKVTGTEMSMTRKFSRGAVIGIIDEPVSWKECSHNGTVPLFPPYFPVTVHGTFSDKNCITFPPKWTPDFMQMDTVMVTVHSEF